MAEEKAVDTSAKDRIAQLIARANAARGGSVQDQQAAADELDGVVLSDAEAALVRIFLSADITEGQARLLAQQASTQNTNVAAVVENAAQDKVISQPQAEAAKGETSAELKLVGEQVTANVTNATTTPEGGAVATAASVSGNAPATTPIEESNLWTGKPGIAERSGRSVA